MADLLSGLPIPLEDQIAEIERELKQRDRVYPRLIEQGRLRGEVADLQSRRMLAALETLKGLRK